MRNNVTFRYPAEFIGTEEDGAGVMAVEGASCLLQLLSGIRQIVVDPDPCQEDWGVVVFAERDRKPFWIGLSLYDEGVWIAHFHGDSLAWLRWRSAPSNEELMELIADFHDVLCNEPAVSHVAWYTEQEMMRPNPQGFTTPAS